VKQSHSRLRGASVETLRKWRRRRILLLLPLVLLFLVTLTRAASERVSIVWIAAPFFLITVPAYLVVLHRDARIKKSGSSATLLKSAGRFRFDDLTEMESLAAHIQNINQAPIASYARGWVEGRVSIEKEGLIFEPGRISSHAGISAFSLSWSLFSIVEVVPQFFTLVTGLELTTLNGRQISCELRTQAPAIREALEHTTLTSSRR
jgi:hypothetical protein